MWRRVRHGEGDGFGLAGKKLVVAIDQVDANLMRAGRQVLNVDCAGIAGVCPVPGQVVDVDVEMADTGKEIGRASCRERV